MESSEEKKAQIGPETAIEKEFARLNPRYESQPGGGRRASKSISPAAAFAGTSKRERLD